MCSSLEGFKGFVFSFYFSHAQELLLQSTCLRMQYVYRRGTPAQPPLQQSHRKIREGRGTKRGEEKEEGETLFLLNSLAKVKVLIVLLTEAKVKMHRLKEVLTSLLLFLCRVNLTSY